MFIIREKFSVVSSMNLSFHKLNLFSHSGHLSFGQPVNYLKIMLCTGFNRKEFWIHTALLHESYLGYHGRMLFFGQFLFSTRYDSGLPKWIIRLRRAQPRRLSTCWLASVRAFNVLPMSCL